MDKITVFISYSHADSLFVDRISHSLQNQGVPIWTDQQIRVGDDWMAKIESVLGNAKVIVFCVSPDFLASDWASVEIGIALSRSREPNVRVIPVLMRDVLIPNYLKRFAFLDARRLRPEEVAKEIKKIVESEDKST